MSTQEDNSEFVGSMSSASSCLDTDGLNDVFIARISLSTAIIDSLLVILLPFGTNDSHETVHAAMTVVPHEFKSRIP